MRDLLTGRIISISLSKWWVGPLPASPRWVPMQGTWNPHPQLPRLTIVRQLGGLGGLRVLLGSRK